MGQAAAWHQPRPPTCLPDLHDTPATIYPGAVSSPRRPRDHLACCVLCLQPHVHRWTYHHRHDHRQIETTWATPGVASLVAEAARCGNVLNPRRVNAILAGDQATVDLDTADIILAAMGRTELLQVECQPFVRTYQVKWHPGEHAPGCPTVHHPVVAA